MNRSWQLYRIPTSSRLVWKNATLVPGWLTASEQGWSGSVLGDSCAS